MPNPTAAVGAGDSTHNDNLGDIDLLFDRREDPRFADGYTWFCRSCDKECNVGEARFECKDGRIIPTYIKCRYGCGASWKLEICFPENLRDLRH